MSANLNECVVYIYNNDGSLAVESIVIEHDAATNTIVIDSTPALIDKTQYNLMILTPSAPYSFSGLVDIRKNQLTIKLFRGEIKEKRGDTRHKISGEAEVTAYLWGGNVFKLHSPLKANLLNISKNGIRISMGFNSMSVGDVIHIRMQIQGMKRNLTALVVNNVDNDRESSDYGCRLVEKS